MANHGVLLLVSLLFTFVFLLFFSKLKFSYLPARKYHCYVRFVNFVVDIQNSDRVMTKNKENKEIISILSK